MENKKQFRVSVEEILYREVAVEASSEEEALSMVRHQYDCCKIILKYDDLLDTSFKIIKDSDI